MNLQQAVSELTQLFHEHSVLPIELSAEAEALGDRLVTGQFHLAVLGQFKRGKSTLINALLGSEILPSGVLPVTLVPVFIRFGSHPELNIRFNGYPSERFTLDELDQFVNEANNPANVKQVIQVEVCYPSSLLQNGIVLIDTPGVGSTLQHNTKATFDFLPRCDAAVVVLSADPPITAAEVEFLQQIKLHVRHLFFVLNKIDYLDSESTVEAIGFLREMLKSCAAINEPRIFAVSARQGLKARLKNDQTLWSKSGMDELEEDLLAFAVDDKQAVLEEAVQRKALNLALGADQLLAVEQQAMQMPVAELEQKMVIFRNYAQNARQKRQEIFDRINGDAVRLAAQIESLAENLRGKIQSEIMRLAEVLEIPTHDKTQIDRFHQEVRNLLDRERIAASTQFKEALFKVLVERAQSAAEVRENLRRDASNLLEVEHCSLLDEEVVVKLAEPAWMIEYLPIRVTPGFGLRYMPKSIQKQHIAHLREELVNELSIRNVEKMRWWLLQILDESINSFRLKITAELDETIRQIDRALQAGYQRQKSETASLQDTLQALVVYRNRLDEVRHQLEYSQRKRQKQVSNQTISY